MKVTKTISLFALAVMACGMLSMSAASAATVYWQDDFEGYTDQTDFDSSWPNVSGTQPTLSTDQSTSPTHSVLEPASAHGRVTSVTTYADTVNGSDAAPLVVEYDIYINPADLLSSRRYVELRQEAAGPNALNLFAIGLSNIGGLDNTKFGFRNNFTWTELAAPRLAGWNHVKAEIQSTDINITINSEPTETFARSNTASYGQFYLGSGFSNGTGSTYIDNVSVEAIPEPTTGCLLLVASMGMALIRRNRV